MDATTIFISGLSLLSLGGLYYNIRGYRTKSSIREEYAKAKVHTPGSLIKTLKMIETQKTARKSTENPDEIILKSFIEGRVECKEPILSKIDKRTPLVFSIVFHDDIRSNDYLHPRDRDAYEFLKYKKSEKDAPVYFALRDATSKAGQSDGPFVLIHRNFEANTENGVDKIAVNRHNKNLNFLEKILIFIGMILEFFNIAKGDNTSPFFRGMKVGWTETEFGIKVNTPLTVFGDVVYNIKDGGVRIDTPLYLLKDKSFLLKKLNDESITNIIGIFFFIIPSALTGVYLGRKLYKFVKDFFRRRRENEMDKARNIKFLNLEDDYKCIICVSNPRNVILKPCLHFSICSACMANMRDECPVCRKHVNDHIEIFFT